MSTPQSIPQIAPRFRVGLGTAMTAIGVLVAIAVSITILALGGANHSIVTSRSSWSASQAAASSMPQTRYLGPRQVSELGSAPTVNTSYAGSRYDCLGPAAQRCLR